MPKFIVLKMRQLKQKNSRYTIFKEKWQLESEGWQLKLLSEKTREAPWKLKYM